jgi:serine protease AprX
MKGRNDQHQRIGRRGVLTFATVLLALSAVSTTQVSAANREQSHPTTGASQPLGSMYNVVDQIGARAMWEQGFTGQGVNVAIIDTGFAPVPDLVDSGRVMYAVDLSAEASVPEATYIDNFGHGTHMSGIIAGRTPGSDPALAKQHPEWFMGVAPDAGIISVKVGDNTGSADISQVIAGVDWATDHADLYDIKVINLSYASGSALPYTSDPLTFALERAWRAGIVVVVAAGNDGRQSHVLSSPAIDPYVIAVGAVEAKGDDQFVVPTWASSGDGTRNPDVAAPGAHIISLRDPGSRIDIEHPEGYVSDELFKGSGSSQAAAVTSGAAALLLSARPDLTPDQVKALLKGNTIEAVPHKPTISGNGVVQVDQAYDASLRRMPKKAQKFTPSDGSGSLEAARGAVHMVIYDKNGVGVPIVGEVTVLGTPWDGVRWTGVRWTGDMWMGVRWTSAAWTGVRWTDASWTGVRWTGASFDGVRWTGVRWTDAGWSGASWTGTSWDGVRWTDDTWASVIWDGVRWTGVRWTVATFDGVRWTDGAWVSQVWDGVRWTGVRWTGGTWDGVRWTGVRWTGVRWTGASWTDGTWASPAWSGGAWE